MTYPQDYSFNVAPTDRREHMIKSGCEPYIEEHTKEQIDKGIKFIREQKMAGESKYLKLDVDLCIGAVRDANLSRAAHNALPAPEGKRAPKDDAISFFSSLKDSLGKPTEPQRIDTTDIESELKERGRI